MGFEIIESEAFTVLLNNDLLVRFKGFLKERKLSIEKVLTDAIPLFVVLWDERQRNRLRLNLDSLLCTAVEPESSSIALLFEGESLKALKEFSTRKEFHDINSIINSSINLFLYMVSLVEQQIVIEINLRNPEGKLIIKPPDYLKK